MNHTTIMLNKLQNEKYSRQISLKEIGEKGQQKLLQAKVLVIGAGGLGCPILQYLAAAGVGQIGIADDDIVSLSNLHRQILYAFDDIGKPKAITAAQKLKHLNPDVDCIVFETKIVNTNAWDILSRFDIIVDGSDNFPTRYLVNDACVLLNKPLVYGSIFRFEGQLSVFNYNGSANYRDVFAEQPLNGEVPDCSEAGVIGVLPGIIGSLMANEIIKLITGTGNLLTNKFLNYNCLTNTFYEMDINSSLHINGMPKDRNAFEKMNYDLSCKTSTEGIEIETGQFNSLITSPQTIIIDVREHSETPEVDEFEHLKIPLSEMKKSPSSFNDETIVLFCQSGKRCGEAAVLIKSGNPHLNKILILKGGILQWKKQNQKQPQ